MGFRVWHETPEEGQNIVDIIIKDEDSSPNTLNFISEILINNTGWNSEYSFFKMSCFTKTKKS